MLHDERLGIPRWMRRTRRVCYVTQLRAVPTLRSGRGKAPWTHEQTGRQHNRRDREFQQAGWARHLGTGRCLTCASDYLNLAMKGISSTPRSCMIKNLQNMHEKSLPPTGARRRMGLEYQDWARL